MAIIIIDESLFNFELNCFYELVFCNHNKKEQNCSRTEQISRHLPAESANDANFVQSAQEEEYSLNQAANLGRNVNCAKFAQITPGQV